MAELKLCKAPGYVTDLMFVFFLKFNRQLCNEKFVNGDKKEADLAHYRLVDDTFSPCSDDLYVFFHAMANDQCFMPTNYLMRYKEELAANYSFDFLMNELSDCDEVIRRLLRFYFYDLSDSEIEKCVQQPWAASAHIKSSAYTDAEKVHLYAFFADPAAHIEALRRELVEKEAQLAAYYDAHYQQALDVYASMSFDTLCEAVVEGWSLDFLNTEGQNMYVTFCLLNKNLLNVNVLSNGAVFMLGYDFADAVQFARNRSADMSIEDFGTVIGDRSRFGILELMLQQGEVCCKDLERVFNFSGSTAYHHLSHMLHIGAIKTRNQGRTIWYSIDKAYFAAAIAAVEKKYVLAQEEDAR